MLPRTAKAAEPISSMAIDEHSSAIQRGVIRTAAIIIGSVIRM